MECLLLLAFDLAVLIDGEGHLAVLDFDDDRRINSLREFTLRTLYGHYIILKRNVYTCRDVNRQFTNSRHIVLLVLIYVAKNITANLECGSFLVSHYTFGRGDDGDSKSVNYAGHLTVAGVLTHTGSGNTLEALDGTDLGLGVVLERDLDGALRTIFHKLEVEDVTFVEENLGDVLLEVRSGNLYHAVLGLDGVAQSGEVVCYRISHCFVIV